mmetsp:Transcript_24726/g.69827  ORF Transcript_24726/g.69827 Transcript_24726/m.69827 type:complete len:222 (-) Transcript_24726:464-1129(-)
MYARACALHQRPSRLSSRGSSLFSRILMLFWPRTLQSSTGNRDNRRPSCLKELAFDHGAEQVAAAAESAGAALFDALRGTTAWPSRAQSRMGSHHKARQPSPMARKLAPSFLREPLVLFLNATQRLGHLVRLVSLVASSHLNREDFVREQCHVVFAEPHPSRERRHAIKTPQHAVATPCRHQEALAQALVADEPLVLFGANLPLLDQVDLVANEEYLGSTR